MQLNKALLPLVLLFAVSVSAQREPYEPNPGEFGPLGSTPQQTQGRLTEIKTAIILAKGTLTPGTEPWQVADFVEMCAKLDSDETWGCLLNAPGKVAATFPDEYEEDPQTGEACKFWVKRGCNKIGMNCAKFIGTAWAAHPKTKNRFFLNLVILAGVVSNEFYHMRFDEHKSKRNGPGQPFSVRNVSNVELWRFVREQLMSSWAEYCTLVKLRSSQAQNLSGADIAKLNAILDEAYRQIKLNWKAFQSQDPACLELLNNSPLAACPAKKH